MGRNRRRKRRRREADLACTASGEGRQPSSFSRAVVVASAATALATGIFLACRARFITEPRSVFFRDGPRAELEGPELVGKHSQAAFELEVRLGDDSDLSQVIEPTQLRPSSEPPGDESCSRISWPINPGLEPGGWPRRRAWPVGGPPRTHPAHGTTATHGWETPVGRQATAHGGPDRLSFAKGLIKIT